MTHAPLQYATKMRFVICAVLCALLAVVSPLSAQPARFVYFTVTDPLNRFVTGLESEHFEVVEGAARRSVTAFSGPDSPITIAVVSDVSRQDIPTLDGANETMIQTRSLTDALRQLAASTSPRKALVISTTSENIPVPQGIQVVRTDASGISRAIIELRSQYVFQVQGVGPSSEIEIVVKQPRGLPILKTHSTVPASK